MKQKKCVIYGRVSTGSDEQSLSIAEQTRSDEKSLYANYLKTNGYEIEKVFSDIQSGTSYDRKGFLDMLEWFGIEKIEVARKDKRDFSDDEKKYVYDVNNEILNDRVQRLNCNRILCKNTSRWTRTGDIEVSQLLKKHGVYIFFIEENIDTQNDDIELVYKIVSHMDMNKSIDTSRKVKSGLKQSFKNKKVRTSGRITGYTLIKRNANSPAYLVQDDKDSIMVRRIFELYTGDENLGVRKIRERLIEDNYRELSPSTIKRILHNEKYAGYVNTEKKWDTGEVFNRHSPKGVYGYEIEPSEYIPNPIIDIKTFEKAQQRLSARSDKTSKRGRKVSKSPYFHKVVCGCCGSFYVNSQAKYSKNKPDVKYMLCGNKRKNTIKACSNPNVTIEKLESALDTIVADSKTFWQKEKKAIINDYLWLLFVYGSYIYDSDPNQQYVVKEQQDIIEKINSLMERADKYPNMKKMFDNQIDDLYKEYEKHQEYIDYFQRNRDESKLHFNLIVSEIKNIEKFSSKETYTREDILEQDIVFIINDDSSINITTGRTNYNKYKEFAKTNGITYIPKDNHNIIIDNITDVIVEMSDYSEEFLNQELKKILELAGIKEKWKFIF